MPEPITVAADEIRTGDEFHDEAGRHHWTAEADARPFGTDDVIVPVRFVDGGSSARLWERGTTLEVIRP